MAETNGVFLIPLGGDVLLSTAIFVNLLNERPTSEVIAYSFGGSLFANFLFMDATPMQGVVHAAIGTTIAWVLSPWLKETYLYTKDFLFKHI